jgi:hypothetical protein
VFDVLTTGVLAGDLEQDDRTVQCTRKEKVKDFFQNACWNEINSFASVTQNQDTLNGGEIVFVGTRS